MADTADPIQIGSRLELLVDDHLVETLSGARYVLHRPVERDVALVLDAPWEGNNCGYVTVFQDGDLYRMYYRGRQLEWTSGKVTFPRGEVYCYAESRDGVRWTKPNLGLVEFDGSTENNIILSGLGCHNFSPFIDTNPECKPDAKYKALGGGKGGLIVFTSADGIRWSVTSAKAVITKGAFDSQNLAFWDSMRGEYREYHRAFRDGRDVMTCTSKDCRVWTEPKWLEYVPGRLTQLYTNQITPYYRAPHLFLGFPARYIAGRSLLTPLNEAISRVSKRFGTDYTDTGFMTSRDGEQFRVWEEAFVRPGPETKARWVYGDSYQALGVVETPSESENAPHELSFYLTEGCWSGDSMALRRYSLRIDGFVSAFAPLSGGEVTTKPLTFQGQQLVLNVATSAAGGVRTEVQTPDGAPIEGFALADCEEIFGDATERVVWWKGNPDIARLAGQPIRLRFRIKDADLYAFRFRD